MIEPQMSAPEQRDTLVRERLREKLTEVQWRRVALLWGLGGLGELGLDVSMSERQVAKREGVSRAAVRQSQATAMERIRRDAVLILLWLDMV